MNFPSTSQQTAMRTEKRPTLFAEDNRVIWEQVRRLLIFLLKELDRAYGWKTFDK